MNSTLKIILAIAVAAVSAVPTSGHAGTKFKIAGKVEAGSADAVLLIGRNAVKRGAITSNKFAFSNLSSAQLKNARLYFFKAGEPVGPGALKEAGGAKFLSFSGGAPSGVKNLSLNFKSKSGYLLAKKVATDWIGKKKVRNSKFTGASLGYAGATGAAVRHGSATTAENDADPSADSEGDGVPDILDIDDDNDGILDDRDSGGGGMISSLYLNSASTINAHLNNLNESSIANTLSGENVFAPTFFIGLRDALASGTGGHVVCDPTQIICRSAADGGTTSIYSGVSESDPSFRDQRWSDLNADGSGKPNLEVITFGGSSDRILVASIQPRTSSFNAGELLTANITNGSSVAGTRVYTILPPVISVPALVSYNAGAGLTTVDYSNGSAPGASFGSPIVLNGNSITFNFYPPQRRAVPGVEPEGAFFDIGSTRLGVLIGGSGTTQEFTCAGLYSQLSDGVTELPTSESMPGGAVLAQEGATLWPLNDAAVDVESSTGTIKSLTVNLATCLSRGGASPGTYMVTLTYAGTDTNFGAPRAAQNIFVTIGAPS